MLFHSFIHYLPDKSRLQERRIPLEPIPGRLTSLINYRKPPCERAALCTSGSLTVEAAVILPMFLIAMLMLIHVLNICQTQTVQQAELSEKAKKLSMYAYLTEEYYSEEYIDLTKTEICEFPVSLIPGYQLKLALRGRVHTWIGRSEEERKADQQSISDELVYVTENYSVYHTDASCTHLKLSIYGVAKENLSSERNESGGRYHACEKCCSASDLVSIYYISESGDCYHTSLACSGLIRKVRLVRRSEVAHLACCTRCQKG